MDVDSVDILQITKNVTLLRGVCSKRLKYEIEYSRKRGTTDNSYILKVDFHFSLSLFLLQSLVSIAEIVFEIPLLKFEIEKPH